MPTDSLKAVLDRDLSKAQVREFREEACSLLREVVNHATWVLRRSVESAFLEDGTDIAALALYRQIVEMTDALEPLISECCIEASVPLIRSTFEALISIEYILQDEEEYLHRSHAWLVSYYYHLLDICDRLDPSTGKGKNFREKSLKTDKAFGRVRLPDPQIVKADKEFITEVVLKDPNLQDAIKEYQSKRRNQRHPKWHCLFDGPADLYGLACEVGRGAEHDLIYRLWSRYCHAGDPSPLMDGNNIKKIRDPKEIKNAINYSISFLLGATHLVLVKFRRGENIKAWFEREQIGEKFERIIKWEC